MLLLQWKDTPTLLAYWDCFHCHWVELHRDLANDLSFVPPSISSNTIQIVSSLKFIIIISILAVINTYCQLVLGIAGACLVSFAKLAGSHSETLGMKINSQITFVVILLGSLLPATSHNKWSLSTHCEVLTLTAPLPHQQPTGHWAELGHKTHWVRHQRQSHTWRLSLLVLWKRKLSQLWWHLEQVRLCWPGPECRVSCGEGHLCCLVCPRRDSPQNKSHGGGLCHDVIQQGFCKLALACISPSVHPPPFNDFNILWWFLNDGVLMSQKIGADSGDTLTDWFAYPAKYFLLPFFQGKQFVGCVTSSL